MGLIIGFNIAIIISAGENKMKYNLKQVIPTKGEIRRKIALSKIIENKGKDKRKSMIRAGFKPSYADIPSQFMNTKKVRKELDWLKYEQEQIRLRMEKTRNKAKYKELGDLYLGLSKINQLLGGNPTDRLVITSEEKAKVDEAFKANEV